MQSETMEGLIRSQNSFQQQIYRERPSGDSKTLLLTLHEQSLTITEGKETTLQANYRDLIGIHQEKITKDLYRISLNSFPRKSRCLRADRRVIETHEFWVCMTSPELEAFKISIVRIITNRPVKNLQQDLKLIVYLNPNAGSNSESHFQNMQQFLEYTNFTFDLVRTTHRYHCKDHLATIDIKQYQAVIIISGDGLMHEFVNSTVCGKIPVSHVPGGSGNAFAKAQTTLAGEECRDEEAMYLVVKGKIRAMNLVKMELEKIPEPIYSFLSFEWAFLADIDMNSQFLRCMGGLRFEVYSAYRCLALRRYNGRLIYSTTSSELPPLDRDITDPSFVNVSTNFLNTVFCAIPFISDQYEFAPLLKVEDEAIDMQFITSEHGRWSLIKYLLNSSNGDHFDKEKGTPKEGYNFGYNKVKSYRLEPLGQGQQMGLFGIDGERYDAQRMQASMSDKKVLTFA